MKVLYYIKNNDRPSLFLFLTILVKNEFYSTIDKEIKGGTKYV